MSTGGRSVDVLVVGAGPTGLALAGRLAAFGASVRVVDGKAGPVAESRALAIQPRTLEVLRGPVADQLLERGNPAVQLRWHAAGRTAALPLFDMGMADTAYPFLLFLSQAETETVLVEQLHVAGIDVEWNTQFAGYTATHPEVGLDCVLRDAAGTEHTTRARYLVGCDGAHSAVRQAAGIAFTGGHYPQTFLLADLDADGLEPDAAHVWFGDRGPVFFFPLVRPAAWRLLASRPTHEVSPGEAATDSGAVEPGELQQAVEAAAGTGVRLGTPVWSTVFKIHHRHAAAYRAGRVFLAGDAAHIHSPAGAQGMNTGIQDAVNLGWKLAMVCAGDSPGELLDSYDTERRPVGAFVLRFTDRAFTVATSTSPALRFARAHLAPRALNLAAHLPALRAVAFRTVSQLGIRYPDTLGKPSPGTRTQPLARLRRLTRSPHPRPGERLPDLQVWAAGKPCWLHDLLTGPAFDLLLCGPGWDDRATGNLMARFPGRLRVHRLLPPHAGPGAGSLAAADESGWRRLGVHRTGHVLVRPDGYVASRQQGTDVTDLVGVLGTWLPTGDHHPLG